jgi:hypothetical protein
MHLEVNEKAGGRRKIDEEKNGKKVSTARSCVFFVLLGNEAKKHSSKFIQNIF